MRFSPGGGLVALVLALVACGSDEPPASVGSAVALVGDVSQGLYLNRDQPAFASATCDANSSTELTADQVAARLGEDWTTAVMVRDCASFADKSGTPVSVVWFAANETKRVGDFKAKLGTGSHGLVSGENFVVSCGDETTCKPVVDGLSQAGRVETSYR